ncbi:MAG: two-component regulator propeller domain-containing protein, partial [Balneolaceae bacterium]
MTIKNVFWFTFAFLTFPVTGLAQNYHQADSNDPDLPVSFFSREQYVPELWNINNGLPVNIISHLYQTPDGYLWLATFNGLVRFDGIHFREFNAGNSANLISNRLLTIQKGTGNSFWLTTEQGNLIHAENGKFASIPGLSVSNQFLIYPEDDKTWIAAESGLYLYQNGILEKFLPDLFEGMHIKTLLRSADESLWVFGKNSKAWRIEMKQAELKISILEIPNNTNTSYEDKKGRIWIGGNQLGYIQNFEYQNIPVPEKYLKKWKQEQPFIFSFREISDDLLLISSDIGILKIENSTIFAIELYEENIFKSRAVTDGGAMTKCPDNSVWTISGNRAYKNGSFAFKTKLTIETILCDREQNLWLTTYREGLLRYRFTNLNNLTFDHTDNNFYGVFSDSYGGYWMGGRFVDLTHIDNRGTIIKIEENVSWGITAAFAEDKDGTLYIGSIRCMAQKRTETGSCLKFEQVDGLKGKNIFAVHVTEDQTTFFGSNEGVYFFKNDILKKLDIERIAPYYTVRFFLETGDGDLWMATNGGGILHYSNGNLQVYNAEKGLSSNNIRALYEDEYKFIWIATEDRGLNRLNPETGNVIYVMKQDGLYDNGLHSILRDDYDKMWMSTN